MGRRRGGGCGSPTGYKRHKRLGEAVCGECKEALAEYQRQYRAENPPKILEGGHAHGRRWTDEEVGFVADSEHLTAKEIGQALGRSEPSVWAIRKKIREGKVVLAPWSDDDVDFVRATPHLTHHEVAKHLGKKPSTIRGIRQRLGRSEGLKFDAYEGNKNPHWIGKRQLLAKTCTKCGLLLDASWFVLRKTGGKSWFAACLRCSPHSRSDGNRSNEQKRRDSEASTQRQQAISLPHAVNHRQPWVGADDKVLADPDLTLLEKAIKLGRTYIGTRSRCHSAGFTSKIGKGDPLNGVWVIENPNVADFEVAS